MMRTVVEHETGTDPAQEERALVERMLGGDERAMEEFADGYFPVLYRFARARLGGDGELTRDIVQTTAVKALEKLGTYRGEAPLSSWLCACCRNEIAMHFRRKKRFPRMIEMDDDTESRNPLPERQHTEAPDGALVRREEADRVHATLDLLPPHYARALEWKYLDRLPVVEIAARLSLGAKAAESVLSRARRAFRESYERLGCRHEPVTLAERRVES